MMDEYKNKTIEQIETEAFRDGVRYALDYLKDVFGDEVAETDLWSEYNSEEGTE